MKTIVLIDKQGHEAYRISNHFYDHPPTQIWHAGKLWDFGVGKLNGEWHYYDVAPTTPTQEESTLAADTKERIAQ